MPPQDGAKRRGLFANILDWMLAPLLLLWPMSVTLTYLVAQSIAARWNPGRMAPLVTASSVKRYAVPISTPIFAPRAASGAASGTPL